MPGLNATFVDVVIPKMRSYIILTWETIFLRWLILPKGL